MCGGVRWQLPVVTLLLRDWMRSVADKQRLRVALATWFCGLNRARDRQSQAELLGLKLLPSVGRRRAVGASLSATKPGMRCHVVRNDRHEVMPCQENLLSG